MLDVGLLSAGVSESALASLAHALAAATDLDAAFVALSEGLAVLDRSAVVALLDAEAREARLTRRRMMERGAVPSAVLDVALRQFPAAVVQRVLAGGTFTDIGDDSDAFARMFQLTPIPGGGELALRGLRVDGELRAVIALYEPRNVFGPRIGERFGALVSLFDLAFARFAERESREEAVRTLEDVTQRVHGEYVARLAQLERQLMVARDAAQRQGAEDALLHEREIAKASEETRRTASRLRALEQQVTAAVGQLEQAHIELHRRSEALRQRTRTIYLLDRVLSMASEQVNPRRLAEGLLALVGDDMQALRCSLFLRTRDTTDELYLAASRGLAPHVREGSRIKVGQGVAGQVALTRKPVLVVDASDAKAQPLLRDEYLTTGSFISFPLVHAGQLLGVVNLTNRAQRGLFVEEDVERVRLLGLVISLVAVEARLCERLLGSMDG